jgi:hypothetical protein
MVRAVVTSCDLGFAPGASGLLRSIARVHPDVPRYCFVAPSLVGQLQLLFGELARVIPVPHVLKGTEDTPARQAHLARYFAHTIPADVVAYFDSDIVVCRPLDEIWNVAPGRVRAVMDNSHTASDLLPGESRELFSRAFPQVAGTRGINSGFFSLRPKDWPELAERFEDVLVAGGFSTFPGFDQPFGSCLFLPHLDPLRAEYNAHYIYDFPIPPRVRAVHFTGKSKPWQPGYPRHEPAYYYWLRYGLGEERFWPLAKARTRIWARTPRRVIGRLLRQWGLVGPRPRTKLPPPG